MIRGKPSTVGRNKVSIRVLLPRADYEELRRVAELERTDISSLVRRAIAHHFFMPDDSNNIK
jgi:hypothetical protein